MKGTIKPMIFARMPQDDIKLIKKICMNRGEDLSDFVRRSVYKELASLSYLDDEKKKALGILSMLQEG